MLKTGASNFFDERLLQDRFFSSPPHTAHSNQLVICRRKRFINEQFFLFVGLLSRSYILTALLIKCRSQ